MSVSKAGRIRPGHVHGLLLCAVGGRQVGELLGRQVAPGRTPTLRRAVLVQFLSLWELVRETVLDPLRADRFVWRWAPDGNFSVSSTYRAFFIGSTELLGAKELWLTRAPPKVKFFFLAGSA